MLNRLIGLFLALALTTPAQAANTTLGNLSAGAAVSATDLFYDVQTVGIGGVKVTGTQLKTFFSASPTFTGTITTPFTGSTQCLQVVTSGVISGTGTPCGGSGSAPGGANTNVQFNNGTTFAGDSGFTYTTPGQVAAVLGTITTNVAGLTITGTFNNAAVQFDAPFVINVTNTASLTSGGSSTSFFADYKLAGVSTLVFGITSAGSVGPSIYSPGGSMNIGQSTQALYIGQQVGAPGADFSFNSGGPGYFNIRSDGALTFSPNTFAQAGDIRMSRQGVGILSIVNGSGGPADWYVYNSADSFSSPTNYERGVMDWTTTTSPPTFMVGTQKGGTGTARNVALTTTRHIAITGGTPTANTCTGFALATGSSDATGTVTYTSATTCSIAWGSAYTNAPFCQVTPGSAVSTVEAVASTSGLAVTFGTAQTAFAYHCFGT